MLLGLLERQAIAIAAAAAPGGAAGGAAGGAVADAVAGAAAGGVVVRASLCQTAMWMGRLGARAPGPLDFFARVTRLLWRSDRRSTTVGDLTYLPPDAAVRMSITPPRRHGLSSAGGPTTRRRTTSLSRRR